MLSQGKKSLLVRVMPVLLAAIALIVMAAPAVTLAQVNFDLGTPAGFGLGNVDLKTTITRIVQVLFGFLGTLAVLLLLYAGFIWMTSGGEVNKIEKAKRIIVATIIGIAIMLMAFAIASFVLNNFGNAVVGGPTCTPGAVQSCSDNPPGCQREQICSAAGAWGSCFMINPGDPDCSGFNIPNKFSYIKEFSSATAGPGGGPWNQILPPGFAGTVNVPKIADLKTKASAQNIGGTGIDDIVLLENPPATWTNLGSFIPNVTALPSFDALHDWNTSAYPVASQWKLKTQVTPNPNGTPYESSEVKVKVYAAHCFNNILDGGETDIDCGGLECGACPGTPCDLNVATPTCEPNNNICQYACDPSSCFCVGAPIINYISPATDPNGDTVTNDASTWEDDVPNGKPLNLVTLSGVNFSTYQAGISQVIFCGTDTNGDTAACGDADDRDALPPYAVNAACDGDWWTDNYILVAIPPGAVDGPIEVINKFGFVDLTNNAVGTSIQDFDINNIDRPGVCQATPPGGIYPNTTLIDGINFPTSGTQQVIWNFIPTSQISLAANAWTNLTVQDQFPENHLGQSSIKIYDGAEYSNNLPIFLSAGGVGDSCGVQGAATCSAASVCQIGLNCDFLSGCTCQPIVGFCDNNNTKTGTEQCDGADFDGATCSSLGLGTGTLSCNNCIVSTLACSGGTPSSPPATQSVYSWAFTTFKQAGNNGCGVNGWGTCDINGCGAGQLCDVTGNITGTSCTCYAGVNLCGNNVLNGGETCDKVNGVDAFTVANGSQCLTYGLMGAGPVTCNADCTANVAACAGGAIGVAPATQGIYSWAFVAINNTDVQPQVIEDCNRDPDCTVGASLPSPTPWNGWAGHPGVIKPEACFNAIISARFNVTMDPTSYNNNNIKLYSCPSETAVNCTNVPAVSITALPTRFIFNVSGNLLANQWYKVVLKNVAGEQIKSNFGIPLKVISSVVTSRKCNVNGATDAAYCWNFKTRLNTDPNRMCPPGCVECSDDPTTLTFPGDTADVLADIDSKDNVCLLINTLPNAWSWSTNKPTKISLPAVGNPVTVTAQNETIFDSPDRYAQAVATHVASGKNDYCRIYNDFTNPKVVQDASCSNGNTQSPTPWINSRDACINSWMSARFNRNMADSTLNTSNIILQKCTDINNEFAPPCTPVTGTSIVIFDYNPSGPTPVTITQGATANTGKPEGFLINPGGNIDSKSWYQVIVLGGDNGVKAADNAGNPLGVLVETNCDYNNDGAGDYCWVFKTNDSLCQISSVNVAPNDLFLPLINNSHIYTALPQAANCNILNPTVYNWNWRSLFQLSDDVNENDATGGSGIGTAVVCTLLGICPPQNNPNTYQAKITALEQGQVNIKARAANTRDTSALWNDTVRGDKWGFGILRIGYGGFFVQDHTPPEQVYYTDKNIEVNFNIDAKSSSLNLAGAPLANIRLYECSPADPSCYLPGSTALSPVFGAYGTYVKDVAFEAPADYDVNTKYRVVVMGGDSGVKSWNDNTLDHLNFNTRAAAGALGNGEECEPNVYPWNQKANICNSTTCLLQGNVCGTRFEQCSVPGLPIAYYPFNATPHDVFGGNIGKIYNNTTTVAGKNDSAYYFNGNNAYIESKINNWGASPKLETVSYWFKADNVNDGRRIYSALFSLVGGSNPDDNNHFRGNAVFTGGKLQVNRYTYILPVTGPCYPCKIKMTSSGTIAPGQWYHVVEVYDWNNSTGKLYINGVETATALNATDQNNAVYSGNLGEVNNFYFWFGRRKVGGLPGANLDFKGSIDEFRIYNSVLSPSRISNLYQKIILDDFYCDTNCQNAGNAITWSCGNGQVETGEQCDDANTSSNDGCNSSCLWEGSKSSYGSLCGNGRIEWGEACDDNNINNSDGCNDKCLVEPSYSCIDAPSVCTNTGAIGSIGSLPQASICGNNSLEKGEECDDGNTNNSDGCSNKCLLSGSSGGAVCGNGLVETGQNDSYSWVFQPRDDLIQIDINDCPNGVWQVGLDKSLSVNTPPANVYICEQNAPLAFFGQGLWAKIINKFRLAFFKFIGVKVEAAPLDPCGGPLGTAPWTVIYNPLTGAGRDNFEEILEYWDYSDGDFYTYNFVPRSPFFKPNKLYKVAIFNPITDALLTEQMVKTRTTMCQITEVKVNTWPQGEDKLSDAFFCYGDDCGKLTGDLYDNDISNSWNVGQFPYQKISRTNSSGQIYNGSVVDPLKSGNQHFYQAWGMSVEGYPLRGSLTWSLTNPAYVVADDLYQPSDANLFLPSQRHKFITSGDKGGDTILTVTANDKTVMGNDGSGSASTAIPIKVFLCNNPWPTPSQFPYYDKSNNCTTGVGSCLNTNFMMYYCRDAGNAASTLDDLPALSNEAIIKQPSGNEMIKEFLFNSQLTDKEILERAAAAPATLNKKGSEFSNAADCPNPACYIVGDSMYTKNDGGTLDETHDPQFMFDVPQTGNYYLIVESSNENAGLVAAGKYMTHEIDIWTTNAGTNNLVGHISPLASDPVSPQTTVFWMGIMVAGKTTTTLDWTNDYNNIDVNPNLDSNLQINKVTLVAGLKTDSDAIGVRVLINNQHLAPIVWYQNHFDPKHQGNPSRITVNGYEAAREGRTVYVNAADLNDNKTKIFNDIYLMSYSDGATSATQNIYNQLLNYWSFNAEATPNQGGLPEYSVCSDDITYSCLTDFGCSQIGKGYCLSDKAKLTRDTRRAMDLQYINYLLENYSSQKHCSNDSRIVCSTSAQCYGGGICGNYYPYLPAGTYVAGRTFTPWPSWQATLAQALGSPLPTDPLDKFSGCSECMVVHDFNSAVANQAPLGVPNFSGTTFTDYKNNDVGFQAQLEGWGVTNILGFKNTPAIYAKNAAGASGDSAIMKDSVSMTSDHYIVKGMVKVNGPIQASGSTNDVGLVFGYGDQNNYWLFEWLEVNNTADSEHQRFGFRHNNGPVLAITDTAVDNDFGWHEITVEVVKNSDGSSMLSGYYDGNRVLNYFVDQSVTGGTPIAGNVGMYVNSAEYEVYFDDFSVTDLSVACTQSEGDSLVYNNILSNDDFETPQINGEVPVSAPWSSSFESKSKTKLTDADSVSGSQSVLLHQDIDQGHPGICSFDICDGVPPIPYANYPHTASCRWTGASGWKNLASGKTYPANKCLFNRSAWLVTNNCVNGECTWTNGACDQTDIVNEANGEGKCWFNEGARFNFPYDNRTVRTTLSYDISAIPFVVGEQYNFKFQYKGNNMVDLKMAMTPSITYYNQTWSRTGDPECNDSYWSNVPGQGLKYYGCPTGDVVVNGTTYHNSCFCIDNGAINPTQCCISAPYQKKPYTQISMSPILATPTSVEWTNHSDNFPYIPEIDSWVKLKRDTSGTATTNVNYGNFYLAPNGGVNPAPIGASGGNYYTSKMVTVAFVLEYRDFLDSLLVPRSGPNYPGTVAAGLTGSNIYVDDVQFAKITTQTQLFGYNTQTCWDKTNKLMACPNAANTYAYTYYAYPDSNNIKGVSRGVYAHAEYDPKGAKWEAGFAWANVDFMKKNVAPNIFAGFDTTQMCQSAIITCGNGSLDTGETCYNCPSDVVCGGGTTCNPSGNNGAWQCSCVDTDGDGTPDNNCSM